MQTEITTLIIEQQPWFSEAASKALVEFQKSQQQAAKVAAEAAEMRAGVSLAESGREALKRAQAAKATEFDAALATVEVCEAGERLVVRIAENSHAVAVADDAQHSKLKAEHEAALRAMVDEASAGHRDIRLLAAENPSPAMVAHRRKRNEWRNWMGGVYAPFKEALAAAQQAARNELEAVAASM